MKEAIRQTAVVGISLVITLIVWLAIKLVLNQAHFQTSTIVDYLSVILLYTGIRVGIKSLLVAKGK